jgi:hypothetical protein
LEDQASYLFDQVSLLWGLSEFRSLAGSRNADIFGKGNVISGEYDELAKKLAAMILDNLEVLHWNSTYQTFYDVNKLVVSHEAKRSDDTEWSDENVISTDKAALAILALESFYRNFPDEPVLQEKAKQLLLKQVEFLSQYLYRSDDGAVYNGASIPSPFDSAQGDRSSYVH